MNYKKFHMMQAELDSTILESYSKRKKKKILMDDLLDNTVLALTVEVAEFANTTRCFKHWSTKPSMEKSIMLEELADCWHFFLSLGNQIGLMADYEKLQETIYKSIGEPPFSLTQAFNQLIAKISKVEESINNNNRQSVEVAYTTIGFLLMHIAKLLKFNKKEVEEAYLAKHTINYQRQKEGY